VLRRGKQFVGGAFFHHLTRVHHGDAAGHFGDDAHIVRNQDQRHAAFPLQSAQQIQNLGLDRHVERGGRLIGDEQARIAGDRHGDHHALIHAARQLMRKILEPARGGGNAHLLQQLRGAA
jgi:hypothetical protein